MGMWMFVMTEWLSNEGKNLKTSVMHFSTSGCIKIEFFHQRVQTSFTKCLPCPRHRQEALKITRCLTMLFTFTAMAS
jgi:hypothetical protein